MEKICESMPKVELHAHLNGSISDRIIQKLKSLGKEETTELNSNETSTQNSIRDSNTDASHQNGNLNLTKCWEAFGKIHKVIDSPKLLYLATCEVIADFAQDNVIYLELRTTPKQTNGIPSKVSYLQSVINAIKDCRQNFPSILVKLLISIDRKAGEKEGIENVDLAYKWCEKYPDIVIGMDVSGDPNFGSFTWIVPLLEEARKLKLVISCHLPEIINIEETEKFLEFKPDRISHGMFLHPSKGGTEKLWKLASSLQIPMEACITSNLISGVCPSLQEHYVKLLHENDLPFAICTDDAGVFKTCLSGEYKKLLQIVQMNLQGLKMLSLKSVSYAFATEKEKEHLNQQILTWWNKTSN